MKGRRQPPSLGGHRGSENFGKHGQEARSEGQETTDLTWETLSLRLILEFIAQLPARSWKDGRCSVLALLQFGFKGRRVHGRSPGPLHFELGPCIVDPRQAERPPVRGLETRLGELLAPHCPPRPAPPRSLHLPLSDAERSAILSSQPTHLCWRLFAAVSAENERVREGGADPPAGVLGHHDLLPSAAPYTAQALPNTHLFFRIIPHRLEKEVVVPPQPLGPQHPGLAYWISTTSWWVLNLSCPLTSPSVIYFVPNR